MLKDTSIRHKILLNNVLKLTLTSIGSAYLTHAQEENSSKGRDGLRSVKTIKDTTNQCIMIQS